MHFLKLRDFNFTIFGINTILYAYYQKYFMSFAFQFCAAIGIIQ